MENLHLKNLKRTDIINQFIKLKEASDEQDDEKIRYYIHSIQKELFPITSKFPHYPDIHIHESIKHIRNIEEALLIDIDYTYTKIYAEKMLKEEIIKYINNLKNYEKRILPEIKEKLKDLEKITDIKEREEELYEIEAVYSCYMFFYKSKIPEITQIVELIVNYAKKNNLSKDYIIKYCKSFISYFKYGDSYTLYKENLNPKFNEYYKIYQRRRNNDPELKKLEANQTADELLNELLDKHLKNSFFSKLKNKFK